MSVTLYVGNISYSMKAEELSSAFSQFGEVVSVKIITDKRSGRSKGYGFVELETDAAADDAVAAMNGKELAGRNIKVNKAHSQTEQPQ
jgi:cold-inducible RNA-binding protein